MGSGSATSCRLQGFELRGSLTGKHWAVFLAEAVIHRLVDHYGLLDLKIPHQDPNNDKGRLRDL